MGIYVAGTEYKKVYIAGTEYPASYFAGTQYLMASVTPSGPLVTRNTYNSDVTALTGDQWNIGGAATIFVGGDVTSLFDTSTTYYFVVDGVLLVATTLESTNYLDFLSATEFAIDGNIPNHRSVTSGVLTIGTTAPTLPKITKTLVTRNTYESASTGRLGNDEWSWTASGAGSVVRVRGNWTQASELDTTTTWLFAIDGTTILQSQISSLTYNNGQRATIINLAGQPDSIPTSGVLTIGT